MEDQIFAMLGQFGAAGVICSVMIKFWMSRDQARELRDQEREERMGKIIEAERRQLYELLTTVIKENSAALQKCTQTMIQSTQTQQEMRMVVESVLEHIRAGSGEHTAVKTFNRDRNG